MKRADATRLVAHARWSSMTKLVAFQLLALADRSGAVAMTQSELGELVGVKARRVRLALEEMSEGGLVAISERGRFLMALDLDLESSPPAAPPAAPTEGPAVAVRAAPPCRLEDPDVAVQAAPRCRSPSGSSGTPVPLGPLEPLTPPGPPCASRPVSENSYLSEISSESKTVEILDFCSVEPRAGANTPEFFQAQEAQSFPKRAARKLSAPRAWRRVPSDWHPNLEHAQMATALGVDLELEMAKFRDHQFRDPRTDPDATFRNWLRNARPTNGGGRTPARAFNRAQDSLDRQLERVKQLRAEEALEAAQRGAK